MESNYGWEPFMRVVYQQSIWAVVFVPPLLTAHCWCLSSFLSDLEAVR